VSAVFWTPPPTWLLGICYAIKLGASSIAAHDERYQEALLSFPFPAPSTSFLKFTRHTHHNTFSYTLIYTLWWWIISVSQESASRNGGVLVGIHWSGHLDWCHCRRNQIPNFLGVIFRLPSIRMGLTILLLALGKSVGRYLSFHPKDGDPLVEK
jgi:hypothetical protein